MSPYTDIRCAIAQNPVHLARETLSLILWQRMEASADVPLDGTPIIPVALSCFAADGREGDKIRVELRCIVHI